MRVFGGDVSRQMDAQGVVLSVFGNVYSGIDISVDPKLTAEEVRARAGELAGLEQGPYAADPELVVLPVESDGGYKLAWRVRAVTASVDMIQYFLDAATGDVLLQRMRAERPELAALLMSGNDERLSDAAALGYSFLGKPYTPTALVAAVKGVLGGR